VQIFKSYNRKGEAVGKLIIIYQIIQYKIYQLKNSLSIQKAKLVYNQLYILNLMKLQCMVILIKVKQTFLRIEMIINMKLITSHRLMEFSLDNHLNI
jgi:hypothetical protein